MMIDHSNQRLGKLPRRRDARTLKLARYLTAALPPAPASVDYTRGITDWGMMLNDNLGCCTIAAVGHAVQAWTANTGAELTVPDSVVLDYYEKWDGYKPTDPASDQGGVELDVLNKWRQQEFSEQPLDAFVAIEVGKRDTGYGARDTGYGTRDTGYGTRENLSALNPALGIQSPEPSSQYLAPSPQSPAPSTQNPAPVPQVATAIWLFGGAYIGVELPITAQSQDIWDVPATLTPDDEPGSWGGHAIYLVGYDLALPIADCRLPIEIPSINAQSPILNGPSSIPDRLSFEKQSVRPPSSAVISPSSPDGQSATDNRQSTMTRITGDRPDRGTATPGGGAQAGVPVLPTLTCITWGRPKKMTWAWFEKYCSEAYALVSKDWLEASGVSPSGFDLATLEQDLVTVTA